MNRLLTILLFCCLQGVQGFSQGIIKGNISSLDGPLSFVHVGIPRSNIGTFTDESGKFVLDEIPNGTQKIQFSSVGFKTQEQQIEIFEGKELNVNIILERSFEQLEELVITGSRTEQKRAESPVVVGVIDKKSLEAVQANTLAQGLNFHPGLRIETDCQTCGYSQLRMNGLGGAYSMILIDSRPIFSSLVGLYGLEMIPSNMIDRIEVVRGGGSAVYGSNAIAGTVNVITREPTVDQVNINATGGLIDNQSAESNFNASVSKVFENGGITLHASKNDREAYDTNGDGFSELPKLNGLNVGLNTYHKIGKYSKLGFNLNSINEYRRGGNKIDEPAHKADQAEERTHNVLMGGVNLKSSIPDINSSLNVYLAGQHTKRKHYTGIDHADAYGNTIGYTAIGGIQYNYFARSHTVTAGTEYLIDYVQDEIELYRFLVDQRTNQLGLFVQDNWKISSKFSLLAGLRLDNHNMLENSVLNPRINLLYRPFNFTQIRASYSSGFRAPQAFDTDLHIAFAGGGVSIIQLDQDLKEETSDSYSLSINYDRPTEKYIYGFTVDAFHTRLYDAFVLEDHGLDEQGNMIMLKKNGGNSTVRGVTVEGRINYNNYLELSLGITFQSSMYDDPVQWSSELEGTREYLRTPNDYGFYTLDINPTDRFSVSLSAVYTGQMLVPHFGGAPGVPYDEVITSQQFFDQNIRLNYLIPFKNSKQEIKLFGGVKNIFNSYQDDFDTGAHRDSNFVYGPTQPRTVFLGIQFVTGN